MTNKESRPQIVLVNRCFVLNDDKKILLIRRAAADSYMPGCWECPGGKLDQGQDLTQAREREVLEETGLLVTLVQPLVYADSYVIGDGNKYVGLPYICLFGVAKLVGGNLKISHEHSDYAWVDYDDVLSYELTPETRKASIILKGHLK
jgi:8-oxo-dGTP diphosphatase